MSYFSTTLTRLLRAYKQTDVATASGIPRSSIAQYASGDRGISVSALGQLLNAFPSQDDQLDLVRAHLRDEIPAEVYQLIEIKTAGEKILKEDPPAKIWQKELDKAINAIRTAAEDDEDVRKLVIDLEKLV